MGHDLRIGSISGRSYVSSFVTWPIDISNSLSIKRPFSDLYENAEQVVPCRRHHTAGAVILAGFSCPGGGNRRHSSRTGSDRPISEDSRQQAKHCGAGNSKTGAVSSSLALLLWHMIGRPA